MVLADDNIEESVPLVLEEQIDLFFFLVSDASVSNGVQSQLFEVGDVEVPRKVDVEVIESYTFISHEAGVI